MIALHLFFDRPVFCHLQHGPLCRPPQSFARLPPSFSPFLSPAPLLKPRFFCSIVEELEGFDAAGHSVQGQGRAYRLWCGGLILTFRGRDCAPFKDRSFLLRPSLILYISPSLSYSCSKPSLRSLLSCLLPSPLPPLLFILPPAKPSTFDAARLPVSRLSTEPAYCRCTSAGWQPISSSRCFT